MQTSLIINTTDSNDKALAKTLTFVNAACPATVLKTAAQKLNALTTNTYVKATRIDKTNVDTATDKGTRSISWKYSADGTNYIEVDPDTMEIPASAINQSNNTLNLRIVSVAGEDGLPLFSLPSGIQLRFGQLVWLYNFATGSVGFVLPSTSPQDLTFTVRFDETEKFVAFEKTFTFHLVGGE